MPETEPPMKIAIFDRFVADTDQAADKRIDVRRGIAIYGLASEIGSLLAAIKKRLLDEDGPHKWNVINEEIQDELGDVLWYGFSLARVANADHPVNIFSHDIRNLRAEIEAPDARGERLRAVLDKSKREEFLIRAATFPRATRIMTFDDYQSIAFLTARTGDQTLIEVCMAVLWQLAAQILRTTLPSIEIELNKGAADRPLNDLLGEIAWHVAAVASLYGVSLSDVARRNMEKVAYRRKGAPTPLHDRDAIETQQFPRKFDVAFVSVAENRCRMYFAGKRLGDELTDNSYVDDGYRYHDIMHLANVAKLGWSPVLRGLMGRKRKALPEVDVVEDGARAQIVEEAVIKAIHSVGTRAAKLAGADSEATPHALFSRASDITFSFLKFLNTLVQGLEVAKNTYWEWEEAIRSGHEIFYLLRRYGQGTVTVDLNARSISFVPHVSIDVLGAGVAGLGSAVVVIPPDANTPANVDQLRRRAQKIAVADALGVTSGDTDLISVDELQAGAVSITLTGAAREKMWALRVVSFKTTLSMLQPKVIYCTAIALSD